MHHVYSVHLFYCTFVSSLKSTHLLSLLLITVAKIPPVAYYSSKDVATYLSRSRYRVTCLLPFVIPLLGMHLSYGPQLISYVQYHAQKVLVISKFRTQ